MNNLINGTNTAKSIKDKLKLNVSTKNTPPCLAVIIVGDDTSSLIYLKHKKIACDYIGIKSIKHSLPKNTSQSELIALIDDLNRDKNINGILVQLPLPNHIHKETVLLKINPIKDVDGFHPYNIGLLSINKATLTPCTPLGCIEMLKYLNIDLSSKACLVIGRSTIVGKPLSMMLINENATVTVAHSKTKNLISLTKQADIIFVALGIPNFLTPDMINDGVIIVDIGIHRIDGKIYGDVHTDCANKSSLFTPVPGGVGPMTIAMLMQNCIKAYDIQNGVQ